jgi:hypothetical protein
MLRKMLLWCALFLAFLAVAHADDFGISRRTPVQPQQQYNQQILPNVARIIAFDSGGQSFGTGSYIGVYGEYGVIVTNWHVVCETEPQSLVHVHFPSGFSSFGAVIETDRTWDLALIAISKPPQSIPTLRIAQTPSKPGDPLWIVGFGSGEYRSAGGRCVRYAALSTEGTAAPLEIIEVSVSARKGDSGGPILNQRGELAGVLFGSDMVRNTAGSYCERVNRFLMETQNKMAGLPSRPETHFAAIEKNGPVHSLRDSRNATPQSIITPRTSNVPGNVNSLGIRTTNRRYTPPVSTDQSQTRQQLPLQSRESLTAQKMPLPSLTPLKSTPAAGIDQAAWAEASPKVGRSVQPAKLAQTAYLIPLEPISMPLLPAHGIHHHVADRYRTKLSADRNDLFLTLFMALNVCCAVGLTCYAVRLLRGV